MSLPTGFLDQEVNGHKYVVFVPRDVPQDDTRPVIVFMNGAGECGTDGYKQSAVGLPQQIRFHAELWPFLVVMPQKPDVRGFWADHRLMVNQILTQVERNFPHDPHRRYITGLSQGGRGTYDLAGKLVWDFAAAAPVCGWSDLDRVAADNKGIPFWAFHGLADPAVNPKGSIDSIETLKAAGNETKITLYEGVDHNSWDRAYSDPELPKWFLAHSLK